MPRRCSRSIPDLRRRAPVGAPAWRTQRHGGGGRAAGRTVEKIKSGDRARSRRRRCSTGCRGTRHRRRCRAQARSILTRRRRRTCPGSKESPRCRCRRRSSLRLPLAPGAGDSAGGEIAAAEPAGVRPASPGPRAFRTPPVRERRCCRPGAPRPALAARHFGFARDRSAARAVRRCGADRARSCPAENASAGQRATDAQAEPSAAASRTRPAGPAGRRAAAGTDRAGVSAHGRYPAAKAVRAPGFGDAGAGTRATSCG